jgi:hypothetical protein
MAATKNEAVDRGQDVKEQFVSFQPLAIGYQPSAVSHQPFGKRERIGLVT